MRRKLTTRGIVAAVAAVVIGCAGVVFLLESGRQRRRFERARAHRPVDIAVDFSEPGDYAVRFTQTFSNSHGEELGLLLPQGVLVEAAPSQLLAGLDARYEIVGADGRSVVPSGQMLFASTGRNAEGFVLLARFSPPATAGPRERHERRRR